MKQKIKEIYEKVVNALKIAFEFTKEVYLQGEKMVKFIIKYPIKVAVACFVAVLPSLIAWITGNPAWDVLLIISIPLCVVVGSKISR
jgi:hypothetical protein